MVYCPRPSIKSQLSTFANTALDQAWTKIGKPKNLVIVELGLQTDKYPKLKELIYGPFRSNSHDGVKLSGPGALRHFTYRVKQVIKPILVDRLSHQSSFRQLTQDYRKENRQTRTKSYSETVKGRQSFEYNIPTYNRFNHLN